MTSSHRVIIFGDSHAQPLVNALRALSFVNEDGADAVFSDSVDCGLISHDLVVETKDRGDMLNPIFQRSLERGGLLNRFTNSFSPQNVTIGLLFGYVDVHMMGFVNLFFEGFDAGLLEAGPGVASGAVDYLMLIELIRKRLVKVDKAVGLLQAAGFNIVLLSAPPPSSDEAIALHQPPEVRAPAGARLSIWHATQVVIAEIGARRQLGLFIDQSRFADAKGLLLPEFVADGVHANTTYAGEYLCALCEYLDYGLTPGSRFQAA